MKLKGKYILEFQLFIDSAAALLKNGSIISAAQEEKLQELSMILHFQKCYKFYS